MARLTDPAGSCARYSGERSSRWARSSGQAMKAFVPGPLVVGHVVVAVPQVAVELESFATDILGFYAVCGRSRGHGQGRRSAAAVLLLERPHHCFANLGLAVRHAGRTTSLPGG